MDQEKETKRQAERCRALAQRIVRELTPCQHSGAGRQRRSAEALGKGRAHSCCRRMQSRAPLPCWWWRTPEWVDLPALQCAQVLLVCTDASAMADCQMQLAAQGLYRDY